MSASLVIIAVLVLFALVLVAVWMWRAMNAPAQITRIAFEEQLALWRIQAIRRHAQAEMQRFRDERLPRSPRDR